MPEVFSYNLPVTILKEGDYFVAYSPALDLSSAGKSEPEAKRMFSEAVSVLFEELLEMGTLDKVLNELGWKKIDHVYQPPQVIDQSMMEVKVPAV